MRTNIVIDDELMANALQMTGLRTKREAVELGLKTLIKLKKQLPRRITAFIIMNCYFLLYIRNQIYSH